LCSAGVTDVAMSGFVMHIASQRVQSHHIS
jgi:hypothetical protein